MVVVAEDPPPSPPPAPKPFAPPGKVRVRCSLPFWFHRRIVRRRADGELVVIDFIWSSQGNWKRWAAGRDLEGYDALWLGPFVIAFHLG